MKDNNEVFFFAMSLLSSVFYEKQYLSMGKEKVRLHYVPLNTVFEKEKV